MLPSSQAEIWNAAPIDPVGDRFILLSPVNESVEPDRELYLTYGAHSNRTLFTEYGFVEDRSEGEVDIQDLMEPLFSDQPQLKTILEEEGYWGCDSLSISP